MNTDADTAHAASQMDLDAEIAHGNHVVIGLFKCIATALATIVLWIVSSDAHQITGAVTLAAVLMTAACAHELMELGWTLLRPSTKGFARAAHMIEMFVVVMGIGAAIFSSPSKVITAALVVVALHASVWFKPIRD